MAKNQLSDVRGVAKAQRERERQEKKAEKLAKRRRARGARSEPPERAGQGRGESREDQNREGPDVRISPSPVRLLRCSARPR